MANINDYIKWRGDISFKISPFNVVDSLILTVLAYVPFDGIVPGPNQKSKISLNDVSEKFFRKYTKEELLAKNTATKYAPFLLEQMAGSIRYQGIKLSGYVDEIDDENQTQFSCISFYLPDNTIYIAFRGTDDSLIGWKEDFNMCFSNGTGGQKLSINYLNKNFKNNMKPLRIGGHSKGGNFAVYASAFCDNDIKENIINIYSNDGPGFVPEVIMTPEYQSILDKVISTVPNSSIIGQLMYHGFNSNVVESTAKGINQHDAFTWQVTKDGFVGSQLDAFSILFDETIKKWANDFDYESRDLFGEILFTSLASTGATKLSQVTGSKFSSVTGIIKSISCLDKKQQALFASVFMDLAAQSGNTILKTLIEKMPINAKK